MKLLFMGSSFYDSYVDDRLRNLAPQKYELFLRMKEIKTNSNEIGVTQFELSDVARVLERLDANNSFESIRQGWKGQINEDTFAALLNLSIISPKLCIAMSRKSPTDDFVKFCLNNQRKCLILTEWGFPFGGAEAFFEECANLFHQLGFLVEWSNFQIPGKGQHLDNDVISKGAYTEVRHKDYPNEPTLRNLINNSQPDLILSHGNLNDLIEKIASENQIPTILGFHFWAGLINLGDKKNVEILSNIHEHSLVPVNGTNQTRGSQKYVVSEFMLEVYKKLGGKDEYRVIKPNLNSSVSPICQSAEKGYVSILDVAVGKGGLIFCEIVEILGSKVPFLAVLRDSTEKEVVERLRTLSKKFPLLKLINYAKLDTILQESKILLVPSLVDETYCRVAEEAVTYGIPVLTSRNGNLSSLLNSIGALDPTDVNHWTSKISSLYFNLNAVEVLWEEQANVLRSRGRKDDILSLILESIDDLSFHRIGIFTVNAPQGLGTLAKILLRQLNKINIEAFVFAFTPYNIELRKEEFWSDLKVDEEKRLTVSSFTREEVPIVEIIQFIDNSKIDVLIFPEVCWGMNWKRLKEIKQLRPNVRIVTMPMLETVIDMEIPNMNDYELTLFPTKQCSRILVSSGVENGFYLGFTSPFDDELYLQDTPPEKNPIVKRMKFLHIAGHSPSVRKNTLRIVSEFKDALENRSDITLTITLQSKLFEITSLSLPPEITIISENLSEDQIISLYRSHDVAIQIPTHEGIGIGFYESISLGVPVVTIDSQPHNEVIIPKKSGWLLECHPVPMQDNLSGVIEAAMLNPGALKKFLTELRYDEMIMTKQTTREFYIDNFSNLLFNTRLQTIFGGKTALLRSTQTITERKDTNGYDKFFNFAIRFTRQYVYKLIPLSTTQKYNIKKAVLKVDGLIRKVL